MAEPRGRSLAWVLDDVESFVFVRNNPVRSQWHTFMLYIYFLPTRDVHVVFSNLLVIMCYVMDIELRHGLDQVGGVKCGIPVKPQYSIVENCVRRKSLCIHWSTYLCQESLLAPAVRQG